VQDGDRLGEVDEATEFRVVEDFLGRYNTTRLHADIGHLPPGEHEASYDQTHTELQVTATT
jgi:transposase InsO family protein